MIVEVQDPVGARRHRQVGLEEEVGLLEGDGPIEAIAAAQVGHRVPARAGEEQEGNGGDRAHVGRTMASLRPEWSAEMRAATGGRPPSSLIDRPQPAQHHGMRWLVVSCLVVFAGCEVGKLDTGPDMLLTACPTTKEQRALIQEGDTCALAADQCCTGSPWWNPDDPILWRCISARWNAVCDVRVCGAGTCRAGERICQRFVDCGPPQPTVDFSAPPD